MLMKILWLSSTPCGAIEKLKLGIVTGGWMKSLEEHLVSVENIELHVAFYYGYKTEYFKYNKTYYYPVFRRQKGSKFNKLLSKIISTNYINELNEIYTIIKNVNPDIIHIHGTEDNWGLIQKRCSIPTLVSLQGILNPYSEKYFSGIPLLTTILYQSIKSKLKLNTYYSTYKKLKRHAKREIEIFSISKNIMGRTDWDKRISRLLSPNCNYFTGNEMLRPVFYQNKWEQNTIKDRITIVSTSTSTLYKGLETIVKTAILLKNNKTISFEWLIVGQTESGTLAQIVKKWLKVKYCDLGIKFMGLKNEFELVEILLSSDVYCQVSHIENSPNSLCEAMILGMPIVASFAGGTDTILTNREEGILYQDGDPYSCAGAILEIVNNRELGQKYSLNARKKALKRHNPEYIISSLIHSYSEIQKKQ